MIKSTSYKKAEQLLTTAPTLSLAVINENGYPIIYPMEKVSVNKLNQVIFITKKASNKVHHLKANNKCCIEVHTEEDMVCLTGKIDIETNEEKIRQVLSDTYIKRLEHSGFGKYCVLTFHAAQAHLYIDDIRENICLDSE